MLNISCQQVVEMRPLEEVKEVVHPKKQIMETEG